MAQETPEPADDPAADLAAAKALARTAAHARRKAAFAARPADSCRHLSDILRQHRGRPLSGYLPIRTEIDPLPAMAEAARHGPVGVPVIPGRDMPLRFARWTPDTPLVPGPFGAMVPEAPEWMVPGILIVPLLAFTATGARLGYGGGFYDRTLEVLRAGRPTLAIGFAFAAQEAERLPFDPNDQPLDHVVTERGVLTPE
ncbi:5-formyltetrahydrofolate cyclo-ligase [Oceaniglobus roseus]|uniref:5-formyltetrahydrofolate cyclo-ligase n=1 Tax=Oceaniglobus roseus TaxID=1737570 RepID=UPI000C7F4462|nr:5-formyltetrahydrofolate cyclo-ligase [Kandeliimicrobium roseum]